MLNPNSTGLFTTRNSPGGVQRTPPCISGTTEATILKFYMLVEDEKLSSEKKLYVPTGPSTSGLTGWNIKNDM